MTDFIFLLNAGATLFMLGLIWTIQLVHYPLFANVGADGYASYQKLHSQRITWIVLPVMSLELLTAIYLAFVTVAGINPNLLWLGLALVLVNWISTLLIQVPVHGKLANGFDTNLQKKLVSTNWIRTLVWTMRGALILWMIWLKIK